MGIRRQPETGQRADPVAGFQRSRARRFLRTGQGRRIAARRFRKIRRGVWAGVERQVQRLFDAVRRYRFRTAREDVSVQPNPRRGDDGDCTFLSGQSRGGMEPLPGSDAARRCPGPVWEPADWRVGHECFLAGYGAWFRAFQGYLDEAAALVDEARAIAIDKNHAYSEAWTLS